MSAPVDILRRVIPLPEDDQPTERRGVSMDVLAYQVGQLQTGLDKGLGSLEKTLDKGLERMGGSMERLEGRMRSMEDTTARHEARIEAIEEIERLRADRERVEADKAQVRNESLLPALEQARIDRRLTQLIVGAIGLAGVIVGVVSYFS